MSITFKCPFQKQGGINGDEKRVKSFTVALSSVVVLFSGPQNLEKQMQKKKKEKKPTNILSECKVSLSSLLQKQLEFVVD